MSWRKTTLAILFIIGYGLAFHANAFCQTNLAIHATQAEVDEWKKRRTSGPYTDDWTRIIANADSFRNSPSGHWSGNQSSTVWLGQDVYDGLQPPNRYPTRTLGDKARDAAFVYLVTGDTKYRDPVVDLLLKQAATSGTDFSNSSKWPTDYGPLPRNGFNRQDFEISNWGRRLIYAYSYVRSSMTSAQRSTTDTWFINMAKWLRTTSHWDIKRRFPNRLSENWGSGTCGVSGTAKGLTHADGFLAFGHAVSWDNRLQVHNALVAAIGAVTGDSESILYARTHFKEWIQFAVFPDGTIYDQMRWNGTGNSDPQLAWAYATTALGTGVTTADHLARAGDLSLYEYSTSNGCHGSSGGPKSLLKVLRRYANLALGNVFAYASPIATSDPALRIDPDGTKRYVYDLAMAQANLYYRDSLVTKALNRATPPIPNNGGYNPWGGDWGNLPGVRFMFGQMENKVFPYPTSPGPSLANAPTNLQIIP
jgi:hypothetical protein